MFPLFRFQILDVIRWARDTNMSPHRSVDRLLHADVNLHDVQRVAVHGAGSRPGAWLFLFRVAEERSGRPYGALSVREHNYRVLVDNGSK